MTLNLTPEQAEQLKAALRIAEAEMIKLHEQTVKLNRLMPDPKENNRRAAYLLDNALGFGELLEIINNSGHD